MFKRLKNSNGVIVVSAIWIILLVAWTVLLVKTAPEKPKDYYPLVIAIRMQCKNQHSGAGEKPVANSIYLSGRVRGHQGK